jgi:hypothetical protein
LENRNGCDRRLRRSIERYSGPIVCLPESVSISSFHDQADTDSIPRGVAANAA